MFVKSPCLSPLSPLLAPPIPSAFTPYPLFQWYPQSKEILLNLSMKCWNSTFNAQGWRVIIIIVQVGAMSWAYVWVMVHGYLCMLLSMLCVCVCMWIWYVSDVCCMTIYIRITSMKIYVEAVNEFKKKERCNETHFTTRIRGKTSLGPNYFVL